ncbi:MAG: CoA pyrophosphatase [Bacteroidales bacterium]|nr:CoA pyrophosphatase [Lentimicrobiaceae bacterium]MDD5694845.1 CoA pyrophosphatase [Bacteroidales bacterium]
MNFNELIEHISSKLKEPLPGMGAHLKMASESRLKWLMEGMDVSKAKKSGVLVLLYPDDGETKLVLIQRPDYEGTHGGQVSLPGGKQEKTDLTLIDTALRETQEELGISSTSINVIGTLSELYIPPSNFLVQPVVGFIPEKVPFRPDPIEVKTIIEVTIAQLLDPRYKSIQTIQVRGIVLSAPCYMIDGFMIWGATAMILSELVEVIR